MSKPTHPQPRTELGDAARLAHRPLAAASAFVLASFASLSTGSLVFAASPPKLTVVERTLAQDQGGWVVNYRVRYHGETVLNVTAAEVAAKVEGWVSNSRVAAHAVPRWSSLAVSSAAGLSGVADVLTASDDSQRCRERVSLRVWTDDGPDVLGSDSPSPSSSSSTRAAPTAPRVAVLSIAPEAIVRVRLRLEHQHALHGDYDPLLGVRAFELRLGLALLRDALPLDREQYLAQPRYTWPTPPEDRRDTRHFVSGPDSLHLEAHVPGNQYYRYPERPIRYATKLRLTYWYLIAHGTEGDCRARVAQYKDTPSAWKVLSEGGHEDCLSTVGRWVKVERVFRTEPDATTLALDFRISGSEIGEMWIDDVRLEPLSGATQTGP